MGLGRNMNTHSTTDLAGQYSSHNPEAAQAFKGKKQSLAVPRQKSNLYLVVFGLIYGIGLLIVVTKKLCPKLIE